MFTLMKENQISSTALLIARALLLADATPGLRTLLPENAATLTRRLLACEGSLRGLDLLLCHRFTRAILFAHERALLPGIIVHWLTRKLLLEAWARDALSAGCRQVVVLGAGLDTLALRLHEMARCFEMDHPATQEIKRTAFPAGPVLVPLDFLRASPVTLLREQTRFDPALPTFYIAEGLLMYFPPARVAELFRELAAFSAPGSHFAFTFMEARENRPLGFANASPIINAWLRWRGEPFHWGLARNAVNDFLRALGWRLLALSCVEELRTRFLAPRGLANAPLATGESIALAELCTI